MHWIKEHGEVLAACDEEIIGKKLKENEKTIHVKEPFYKGRKVDTKELKELIEKHENINLIGKQTVKTAQTQRNLNTKKINGIPYAIIITVHKKG